MHDSIDWDPIPESGLVRQIVLPERVEKFLPCKGVENQSWNKEEMWSNRK